MACYLEFPGESLRRAGDNFVGAETDTSWEKLDELSRGGDENLKVNIYAFIANSIMRSRPTDVLEDADVVTQLELRDGTSDTDTTCIIYSDSLESFSDQIQTGQIIRMHRAKIKKMADGKLLIYGKLKTAGFAVLLFSGQLGDDFIPVYQSSAKFTVASDYKERINSLRMLFVSDEPMALGDPPAVSDDPGISDDQLATTTSVSPTHQKISYINEEEINQIIGNADVHCLNEFVLGRYSDITVQAIALFIGDRDSIILRCWDTTSPPRKIFVLSADFIHEVICRDEELEMTAKNYWCDIVLYEEHANFARDNVKCGDILLLINTHLYHSKNGVTLTMHGGGQRYKRSIIILDDNNRLKLDLLRNIDGFNASKVLLHSNLQTDIEDGRNVAYPDVQLSALARSSDETNDLNNEQIELWKCWAGERLRQMHAVQLAWIRAYAWKKKRQPNAQLQRSFNLARMAVQFIVRQVLERLSAYNRGNHTLVSVALKKYSDFLNLFANLTKLSRRQRNILFTNFLLTYVEGTYGDAIALEQTNDGKQSDDMCKFVNTSEMRKNKDSQGDAAWDLLCNLLPGTILKSSGCNLWCTTSARNFDLTPLCPVCFKREVTDSHLFLQCYFLFNGIPHEAAFFLVDVPKNAQEAAENYRRGLSDDERKALAGSIQEQMLSKYLFTLDEVIVRKIKGNTAILEVGKLTFVDR
uniref:Protection of telomeres protein 1 n=1 Tax=Elaeophora elaphi TaxID=1147741 RepID=A0A0R3RU68_9BILA